MDALPVLIVGAGPTGLLLSIWLKTLSPSINFRIIDRSSGPCQNSRAIVVQARTMEFYRQLGIIDEILEAGHVVQAIQMQDRGQIKGELKLGEFGKKYSKYGFVLSLPQDRHERILVKHLERLGVTVEWNTALKGLVDGDHCTAILANGEVINAQYVAGCDGLGSVVRQQAGIKMEGDARGVRFFVADVQLAETNHDMSKIRICLGQAQFALCLPLGDKGNARVLGQVPDELPEDGKFTDMQEPIEQTVKTKFTSVNWHSIYRVTHQVAEHFSKDRVFLLGDAAHVHNPVGGQGMNTGLGDASNLAWKLHGVLSGTISPEILLTYEAERRPFALTLVKTTDRAFTVVTQRGIAGYLVRSIVMARILPLLWRTAALPQTFFQRVSQLGISYADGPLGGAGQGLRAGDRLPWVSDTTVDNHASLTACSWQVHKYGAARSADLVRVLHGSTISQHDYMLSEDRVEAEVEYLIRPDGYIAATAKSSSDSLSRFFQDWAVQSGHATGA